ncbi:MAG: GAF domain-containing protein [Kastovskya adunca ATA6-11-RM4]|jgi:PAS domain S-box-containing protein|nr:GAF domain-containing protein [Kastovskya adunca ATA6-11-RM4]
MKEIIKILVVEDDEVDRMAVRRALQAGGVAIEMAIAEDCKSALKQLSDDITSPDSPDFDCIFLDYRLPDGDGLKLVRDVRDAGISIPMIVLTGQGDEQIAVELMKAGASDYLPKAKISSENLSRSLRNAVRIYRAEREAALAQTRLRESEERYRLVLEGSNDGIWDWDLITHEIYCNDRLFEIAGLLPTEIKASYELFCQLLHPEDRMKVSQAVTAHLQHNDELDVEFRLLNTSGEYRYCIARGKAQRDARGKPLRMSGLINDITERKRAEASLRFLVEASSLLSASLDYEKTLASLAQLAVPFMADLCVVDIVENGVVRRVGVAHADPKRREQVQQLRDRFAPELNSSHPAMEVVRTGVASLVPEVNEQELAAIIQNAEHLQIIQDMDFKSYTIVPLLVRGRTLGAISFVSTQTERRYGPADVALAEELARRAALSIENGQLYREAQEASENLRQAILILGEQQQQLRTLQQLTNLLNQRLTNLPGLLREMVKAVCDAIPGANFCFIMLQNPQCNSLILTVTAGIDTENLRLEDTFDPGNGLLTQVFATGEPQLIQLQTYQSQDGDDPLPAAIYAVAIESVQGRLGVLAIGNWDNPAAFDEEDRHLLNAVGEQAAIAIDNARMIKALEEQEERLEFQNEMLADQNQELEKQRQQLQVQNLQLLEAARLKSQFLSTMSHELRTPMNAIIGFSQLLLRQRQTQFSSQQVDMMKRILSNGKHLLTLINEILDLSKIEAGRLDLQVEELDLRKLVGSTIEELRSLADEKRLVLNFLSELQNSYAINDGVRLRQILANLISNAIKFTAQGSVEVSIREVSPDRLAIAVKDTGIGISQKELKHIFEEFRQVDQSLTKKYPGTGLGLAITKSLVQLMQGTISVESEPGNGSTFCIELPRQVQGFPPLGNNTANVTNQPSAENASTQLRPQPSKNSHSGRQLY